ncbi:MAG: aldo/keto reductase [Nitrospirae bacterium]|nr:aldo/keto reductase [Nitrospirota bacterium]
MGVMVGAGLAATSAPRAARAESSWIKRPIPSTGEEMPVVGLGTWQAFDVGNSAAELDPRRQVLARFVERGAKVVDSSPMYGRAEVAVGRLVAELGIRNSLFLATKVWTSGHDGGVDDMNRSFDRLRVDELDLMQVHNLLDAETHLRTLAEWKAAGRLRYVGVTHYVSTAYPEIEQLAQTQELDFVQLNYSLAEREAEQRVLDFLADRGVGVIVNRPFAGGKLFGRVRDKELPDWAAEIDCATWGQFFLKYVLGHPAVTCVIPGTSKVGHLDDNLDAGMGSVPDASQRRRMVEYFDQL